MCSAATLAGYLGYKMGSDWSKSLGKEATLGQYPHVAILRNSSTKKHFCSGAIVGQQSIVTAAHCVDGMKLADFEVVVGTILNNVPVNEQNVYKVAKIKIHPEYENLVNDIALVHTAGDIRFSNDVKAVKLGTIQDDVGVKLFPAGWGIYKVKALRLIFLDFYLMCVLCAQCNRVQ